jgi:hypothetical protein
MDGPRLHDLMVGSCQVLLGYDSQHTDQRAS